MLTLDPNVRPSAEKALQHSWLKKEATVDISKEDYKSALENMKGFRAKSTLQKATQSFIASQILSKEKK